MTGYADGPVSRLIKGFEVFALNEIVINFFMAFAACFWDILIKHHARFIIRREMFCVGFFFLLFGRISAVAILTGYPRYIMV